MTKIMNKPFSLVFAISSAIYKLRHPVKTSAESPDSIEVICISDTHNLQLILPAGDLLVHAGDLTTNGTFQELQKQVDWLDRQ